MKRNGRKIHLAREVTLPWAARPAGPPARRAMPTAPVYPMERVTGCAPEVPAGGEAGRRASLPPGPGRRPAFLLAVARLRRDPFLARLSRLE